MNESVENKVVNGGREGHRLSELIELANSRSRREAMKRYIDGDAHFAFLMAHGLKENVEACSAALMQGKVAAQLGFFGDAKQFRTILNGKAFFTYHGCELPSEEVRMLDDEPQDEADDAFEHDASEILDDASFAQLSTLPTSKLVETLIVNFDCEGATFLSSHKEDSVRQREAYEAIVGYCRLAARHAASIGSESAKKWLEVRRLLLPREREYDGAELITRMQFGLDLIAENVEKAHALAKEAQAQLWVDVEHAKLKREFGG